MKNTHIKAGEEVPIELRKEIYKDALDVIEKGIVSRECMGLCLILPKLLWGLDLNIYLHKQVHFKVNHKEMFPELKIFLNRGWLASYTDEERINFLKSVI